MQLNGANESGLNAKIVNNGFLKTCRAIAGGDHVNKKQWRYEIAMAKNRND